MIFQWYAEHFGASPNSLMLALIVIGVIAVLALLFVAVARTLDRELPDETATEVAATAEEGLAGQLWVTVIATGFDRSLRRERRDRVGEEGEREPVTGGFDVPADVLEVPSFLRRR